jgi:hypothetical protein
MGFPQRFACVTYRSKVPLMLENLELNGSPASAGSNKVANHVLVDSRLQNGERLVFETLPIPGRTTAWAWSYWKDV